MNIVFFDHRKTGVFVCLFLAICLLSVQMQVDVGGVFMPSDSARDGMVFLFFPLYYMQVYMSHNRHLYFSGTLIRYIQNQNGL